MRAYQKEKSETELKIANGIKPEIKPKLDAETEPTIGLGKEIETRLETEPENAVHEGSNPPLKRDGSDEEYPNGDKKMGNIRTRSTDYFHIVQSTSLPPWFVIT